MVQFIERSVAKALHSRLLLSADYRLGVDGPFSFADWATRAEIEAARLAREPPPAI